MATVRKQTVVITGASSGIGAAAAGALTVLGLDVVALVRDPSRAPPDARETFSADLSNLAEAARVGRELAERLPRIDVLVNNAGVHAFSQRITADGRPIMVAVNHLARFVLTELLLPKRRECGGCVVHVASDTHRRVAKLVVPDDLVRTDPFGGRESARLYAQSKVLGVLFTKALARRLAETGATANSCCPGLNVTGLGRESRMFSSLAKVLSALGAFSPARGAAIVVQLVADSGLASTNGAHFSHGGDVKPDTSLVADVDLQERLWAETAALPTVARLGVLG